MENKSGMPLACHETSLSGVPFRERNGKTMKLEDLQVYQLSMEIGEKIWKIVGRWGYFEKDTVGKQLVRAADSIAANLSEGYGRFHYRENKQFCYYSRGSLQETLTWLEKAHQRELISDIDHSLLNKELQSLSVKLNRYITSIGKTSDN
jgi:four helix bundle protein